MDASVGKAEQHKFSLKIRTDQRHASELVGILTGKIRPVQLPVESATTGEMSTGLPVSKAHQNPTATPTQLLETKFNTENIGVTGITSQMAIPGVFIPNNYNSSNESNDDDQSDGDGDNDDSDESESDS